MDPSFTKDGSVPIIQTQRSESGCFEPFRGRALREAFGRCLERNTLVIHALGETQCLVCQPQFVGNIREKSPGCPGTFANFPKHPGTGRTTWVGK